MSVDMYISNQSDAINHLSRKYIAPWAAKLEKKFPKKNKKSDLKEQALETFKEEVINKFNKTI